MEPRWDIAAVVVAVIAVPLAMSPAATLLLSSLFCTFIRTVWPAKARCERLEWIDIPDGLLHECTIPPEHCEHIKAVSKKGSWNDTIATFFTLIRRGTFVKKPQQLDWYTDYVRTDYKTLMAMVLLLTDPGGIRFEGKPNIYVVFKEVGSIWTAYIKASRINSQLLHHRLKVTKLEMEGFLRGYPPWYQQPLVLANGNTMNHPIKDLEDLSRGGWIVAIGLSQAQPIAHDIMDRSNGKPSRPVINALLRIHHCLRNLMEALPEERIVREAEHLMCRCMAGRHIPRGSRLYSFFRTSLLSECFNSDRWFIDEPEIKRYASTLSDAQCVLIMRVFSQYDDPSNQDIEELQPVLEVAIRVAMTSVWKVLLNMSEYHESTVYEWPEQIKSRAIYLRDRFEDEDV
jgi:hypothetical protein